METEKARQKFLTSTKANSFLNSKNGEIVEQKVFYDLVGMQKQMGLM